MKTAEDDEFERIEREIARRLAEQPAQEQTMYLKSDGAGYGPPPKEKLIIGYDTTPPQRTWVGLTDEEMSDTVADIDVDFGDLLWKVVCLTKIIEAKLKEKNT